MCIRDRSLLSEAGYADGFEMSIWVQSSDQIRQEACVIIQSMLEEVGITVTVEPMDGTVMDDTIVKGGDFAACSSMYYNLMGDADYVLYSNISPESTSNLSHYSSEAAMEKLLAARSLTDDAARAAVYAEISAIMAQDRPYIPLWAYQNLVGVRTGVQGLSLIHIWNASVHAQRRWKGRALPQNALRPILGMRLNRISLCRTWANRVSLGGRFRSQSC